MKICAQNPINGEYSLCGMAFDAPESEEDEEPFDFATPGEKVTCEDCLSAIALIHEIYTPKGKAK